MTMMVVVVMVDRGKWACGFKLNFFSCRLQTHTRGAAHILLLSRMDWFLTLFRFAVIVDGVWAMCQKIHRTRASSGERDAAPK